MLIICPELARVIQDEAPDAIKPGEIKNQFGRKVAIVSRDPEPPGARAYQL